VSKAASYQREFFDILTTKFGNLREVMLIMDGTAAGKAI